MSADLELWASKSLDLLWLPRCDNWHCPSLHEVTRDPFGPHNPIRIGELRWFWRVDSVFVAWGCRAIHRATNAGAQLPASTHSAFQVIRSYLLELHPGSWESRESLALSPVTLTGSEILPRAAELARLGLAPRWDGWEKYVSETDGSSLPPATAPARVASVDRPGNPGMFD